MRAEGRHYRRFQSHSHWFPKPRTKSQRKAIKIFEYLSKHAGLLTLCSTIFIAMASALIKAFIYTYKCGEFFYWGVSYSYIDLSDGNLLYNIFLNTAIAVVLFTLNALPYGYIISSDRKITKLKQIGHLLLITFIIFLILFVIWDCFELKSAIAVMKDAISIIIYSFLVSIMLYMCGIILGITTILSNKWTKKKQNEGVQEQPNAKSSILKKLSKTKACIIIVVISLSIYALLFYCLGVFSAFQEKTYKIINNNQVVVYEGNDFYLVSECEPNIGDNESKLVVNKAVQTEIKKSDITVKLMRFQDVKFH